MKWTLGDDFMIVSVFSAELGSTADTCTASVYGAFKRLTYLLHEGRLGSPYSALCLVQQWIHALCLSTTAWDFHGFSP